MMTTSAILAKRWETNAMNETAQQYIQRITANVEGKQPLAVQAATAKKLERIIKGVPTAKLRKRPAPDKWSVNEILAHLADTEIVVGFRIRLILDAPGTPESISYENRRRYPYRRDVR